MNRRAFLTGLVAAAGGLVLPYEPRRVYSFGEDVGRRGLEIVSPTLDSDIRVLLNGRDITDEFMGIQYALSDGRVMNVIRPDDSYSGARWIKIPVKRPVQRYRRFA